MEKSDVEYLKALTQEELEYVINNLELDVVAEILEVLSRDEPEEEYEEPEQVERPKAKVKRKRKGNNEKVGENLAQRENIKIIKNRPNKFLTDPAFNAHKEDVKFDKAVWKGKQPTPRCRDEAQMVDIECQECGKTYEISASLVPPSECTWKCNNCY